MLQALKLFLKETQPWWETGVGSTFWTQKNGEYDEGYTTIRAPSYTLVC